MSEEHVAIELHGPENSRALATTIGDLYHAVFSLPPFLGTEAESRSQRSYYRDMLMRPGFQLATARDRNEYIGFAYGYLLPQDTKRWNGLSEDLSGEFIEETGTRTFAIIDFGVLSPHRGKGTGKVLHDSLLSASGAQRATLSVQPKAMETQAIYRHWGWRRVGQTRGALAGVPVTFDVYVLTIAR